jgi:hypothetical protein
MGVEGVGVKVINNSLEELKEPDKSNAIPAIRILAALMLASSKSPSLLCPWKRYIFAKSSNEQIDWRFTLFQKHSRIF